MRKLIFLFSSFLVFSCGNSETVTVSKEEYNRLKNIPPPKIITFSEGQKNKEVVVASDGHEYYQQQVEYYIIYLHYIDCKLCAKINKK